MGTAQSSDVEEKVLVKSKRGCFGDSTPPPVPKGVLHGMAENGFLLDMEHAISMGADVNEYDENRGWTPLHHASAAGRVDSCRTLIQAGALHSILSKQRQSLQRVRFFIGIIFLHN